MGASISLLVLEPVSTEIIRYSQKMCDVQRSSVRLSEKAEPHVTLLKTRDDVAISPADVAEAIPDLLGMEVAIDFEGLNILPSRSGGTWVEIQVLKSDELAKLHRALIERGVFPEDSVENDIDDLFRTHITVARFIEDLRNPVPLDVELLRRKRVKTVLVVGASGNTFYQIPARP